MRDSVLIVHGDRWQGETLGAALAYEGYQAEHTGTGTAALALLGQRSFQLVLLDVSTPATGSWETLERLVLLRPDLPVIVLAPFEQKARSVTVTETDAAMAKQVDFPTLLRAMQRALSRPAETYVVHSIESERPCLALVPMRAVPRPSNHAHQSG